MSGLTCQVLLVLSCWLEGPLTRRHDIIKIFWKEVFRSWILPGPGLPVWYNQDFFDRGFLELDITSSLGSCTFLESLCFRRQDLFNYNFVTFWRLIWLHLPPTEKVCHLVYLENVSQKSQTKAIRLQNLSGEFWYSVSLGFWYGFLKYLLTR